MSVVKESKRSHYLWKIVWLIGLIILANFSIYVENHFKQIVNETFNPFPLIWYNSLVSFIFGIYISFVFIKKWSLNVNTTLLCFVFIPSLLISFCYPILVIFETNWDVSISFIPYWLIRISVMEVFGIISGLSLILGIFTNHLRRSDNE